MEPEKRLEYHRGSIDKQEFADMYGVSRKTIIKWIKKAKRINVIPHRGKKWKPCEIKEMIEHFGLP